MLVAGGAPSVVNTLGTENEAIIAMGHHGRDGGPGKADRVARRPESTIRRHREDPHHWAAVGVLGGRPRGRIVRSRPSRVASRSTHEDAPKGSPDEPERRMAASSSSEGVWWTKADHRRRRVLGVFASASYSAIGSRSGSRRPRPWAAKLLQR